MLELFHANKSTCSQKVRICLAEKGLDYTNHQLNLATGEHLTPEFLAINPNGVVPALRHDGRSIVESTVICEYLDEIYRAPSLIPGDPVLRAEMRAWLRFIDEVPSMAVRIPSFNKRILPAYQSMTDEEFMRFADAMANSQTVFFENGKGWIR